MSKLTERYGAGPLHMLAALAMTAICGYGAIRILGSPDPLGVFIWLAGAVLLHDAIAFPLYTVFARIAFGRACESPKPETVAAATHLRVAIFLSGLLFIVWFPEILTLQGDRYTSASGVSSSVFLERWLLLSAGIFVISGLSYALRVRGGRMRTAA